MSRPTNQVQIDGRLGNDPELRFTPSGHAVANFSIGHTPRRKQGDEWVDGETVWMRCSIWRDDAEKIANEATKGDLVLVTGTLEARSWDDKETGQKRTVVEIQANTATVLRKKGEGQRSQPSQGGAWGGGQAQPPASDPWATQPAPQQTGGAGNAYDEPPF